MRVGIVGASSLMGRELAEVLVEELAGAQVVLLDEEGGQMTAVGDEAAVIQRIEKASFEGMDLCFFAAGTKAYWEMARDAGVGVVDLTDALRAEAGVVVGIPWVEGGSGIEVGTGAVIPGHAVAVMLGLVAGGCRRLGLKSLAATVMVPASERGQAGLDEMQRQAVSLLTFQAVPREEFDAQVAFNLVSSLGEGARVTMEATGDRIRADYAVRAGWPELAMQMVHAPVFHGYGVAAVLGFEGAVTPEAVGKAIQGEHFEVVGDGTPSTAGAAGLGRVQAQVSGDTGGRVWVWMTADPVRLTALHAVACGWEMLGLRPRGRVQ